MGRNLYRRIEVAMPVLDHKLKRRILSEGLQPYLKDNQDAWELDADGEYQRKKPSRRQHAFSAQNWLMQSLGQCGSNGGHG